MYINDNMHRFPALVLALGLTTAVVTGLSALAQSKPATVADAPQMVAIERPAPQALADAVVAPLRVRVVGTRS